ncbi:hypothetical protein cmbei_1002880 [Cryptosporidium meleagridis]
MICNIKQFVHLFTFNHQTFIWFIHCATPSSVIPISILCEMQQFNVF